MKTYLFIVLILLLGHAGLSQKFILDADTGNEMDDLYAIAYLLGHSGEKILALSAAHFNNVDLVTDSMWNSYPVKGLKTMMTSYGLNKELLAYTNRSDIRCLKGAEKIIGRAWGGNEPRPSEASKAIIDEALKMKKGEKLIVFTLGAVTNVASALIENPAIQDKIVLYMMGASYDADRKAWNKSEFNIRNDLNAFDYLLNSNVEMHIMPASTASKLKFNKQETLRRLNAGSKLDDMLAERWTHMNAGDSWIMWDLAMLIAYINPGFVTERSVPAPPENRKRNIFVYTDLDREKMEAHFWEVYRRSFQK